MKKILVTLVALVAMTLSVSAQGLQNINTWTWTGGPGKSYVDRSTLDRRANTYHSIINDKNSDIKLCIRKDGKKAWYSFNGGVHFMAFYDEAITLSEKAILDKRKKTKTSEKKGTSNQNKKDYTSPFDVDVITVN